MKMADGEKLVFTNLHQDTGAEFSACRLYRYRLWRVWNDKLPRAAFVLMNPSTADEINDDPTVQRQSRRVHWWPKLEIAMPPCGGVEILNAFAWRETDSTKLAGLVAKGVDIIGPENDYAIAQAVQKAAVVICGWGMPGNLLDRGNRVLRLIRAHNVTPYCLRLNKDGTPQHPLYLGYDVKPYAIVDRPYPLKPSLD